MVGPSERRGAVDRRPHRYSRIRGAGTTSSRRNNLASTVRFPWRMGPDENGRAPTAVRGCRSVTPPKT